MRHGLEPGSLLGGILDVTESQGEFMLILPTSAEDSESIHNAYDILGQELVEKVLSLDDPRQPVPEGCPEHHTPAECIAAAVLGVLLTMGLVTIKAPQLADSIIAEHEKALAARKATLN